MNGPHRVWSCTLTGEDEETELAALERELRERRVHFVEEARLLARYLSLSGLNQRQGAARLGRSQSSVANRLRLLKLPGDVLDALEAGPLSERHGRALLRLGSAAEQREALRVMQERPLSVAEAEAYIDARLRRREDLRALLTPLEELAAELRRRGVSCRTETQEDGRSLSWTVRLEKEEKSPLQKTDPMI